MVREAAAERRQTVRPAAPVGQLAMVRLEEALEQRPTAWLVARPQVGAARVRRRPPTRTCSSFPAPVGIS
jgi:hypothetical protein